METVLSGPGNSSHHCVFPSCLPVYSSERTRQNVVPREKAIMFKRLILPVLLITAFASQRKPSRLRPRAVGAAAKAAAWAPDAV